MAASVEMQKRRRIEGSQSRSGRATVAIADQIVSSGTNFAVSFIASFVLPVPEFASVVIAFAIGTILISVQRAVVGEPLLFHLGRVEDDSESKAFCSDSTMVSVLLGVVCAAAGLLLWFLGVGTSSLVGLVLLLLPIVFLQDVARSSLLGYRLQDRALYYDSVWAVVQFSVLLAWFKLADLSPIAIVTSWGIGALASAVLFYIARPLLFQRPRVRRWWRAVRTLSGWNALTSIVGQIENYLIVLVAGVVLGAIDASGLRAMQLFLLQPTFTLTGALVSFAIPLISRASHRRDATELGNGHSRTSNLAEARPIIRMLLLGACVLSSGVVVVAILKDSLVPILFPKYSPFTYLVVPLAVQAVLTIFAFPYQAAIRGAGQARVFFLTQISSSAIFVLMGFVGAVALGATGLAWGTALGLLVRALYLVYAYRRATAFKQTKIWIVRKRLNNIMHRQFVLSRLAVSAVVVLGTVTIAYAVSTSQLWQDSFVAYLPPLVAAAVSFLLIPRISASALSPLPVLVIVLLATAFFGQAYATTLSSSEGAGARLILSDELVRKTSMLLATSAVLLLLGGVIFAVVNRSLKPAERAHLAKDNKQIEYLANLSIPVQFVAVGLCAIPLVSYCANVGISSLVNRATYLAGTPGSVASLASPLMVVAVVGAGLLLSSNRLEVRVLSAAIILMHALVFFSLGTRRFALIPVLVAVGLYLGRPGVKTKVALVVGATLSFLLLPVPLYLRSLNSHGFAAYIESVWGSYAAVSFADSANNLVVSFPLIGTTAFESPRIPISYLLIQLNPWPGEGAGWYEIQPFLRINTFTPYAGLGELGNVGGAIFPVFWIILGAYLVYLDGRINSLMKSGLLPIAIMLFGFVALFAVTALQYNLRTGMRILYYGVAVDLILRILMHGVWSRRLRGSDSVQACGDVVEVRQSSQGVQI